MTSRLRIDVQTPAASVSQAPKGWPAPMRPEAFHGLPGAFVEMVDPHTEADRHGLLIQLLAAAGNAVGRAPGLMADGAFHPTLIWPVLVGVSAKARKGTSWSRVREVMELADPDWAATKIEGGLSTGEGLANLIRDERRKRRKAKTGETPDDDGMVEEIADAGVTDKRICVVETEFAQVFKVLQREGNTLGAVLRTLWDHGNAGALSKHDPVRVTRGHPTVIGHCTTDELRSVISATDLAGGLVNRFLFCCVRRTKKLPEGGFVPVGELEEFATHLGAVIRGAGQMNGRLERSDEAKELWVPAYDRLTDDQPGKLGSATSRAEAQVARLSLIYAVLDASAVIDTEHLEAALAVWDYCFASAGYVFGGSTGDGLADKILSALRLALAGMTRTQIRELVGGAVTEERIEVALEVLTRYGLAVMAIDPETGGRPAERWWATRKEEP